MPNTFYPAVCAVRAVQGHEACERADTVESDTARVHRCAHGYVVAACLTNVKASEIGPRLDQLGALLDPVQGVTP